MAALKGKDAEARDKDRESGYTISFTKVSFTMRTTLGSQVLIWCATRVCVEFWAPSVWDTQR